MADPSQQPALDTPPGVISHFPTTHSSEQVSFYIAAVLLTVVPGFLLVMRIYTKIHVIRKVDLPDVLVVIAFGFLLVLITCAKIMVNNGAGVHQWNVPLHNSTKLIYWFYIGQIVYCPAIYFVKCAIVLQYAHTFAPQKSFNPFMWWAARIFLGVTAIYYTISTLLTIFQCSPREAIWDALITDGKCYDNNTLVLFTCLYNILSDIFILILPARAVWQLHMPLRKKMAVCSLFAIGLLACIANVMIIYYVSQLKGKYADVTYNAAWEGLWAMAEVSLGMVVLGAFSLPRFMDTTGARLLGTLTSFTRRTLSSDGFSRSRGDQSTNSRSRDVPLDEVNITGHSQNDVRSIDPAFDTEGHSSTDVPFKSIDNKRIKVRDGL